LPAFFFPAGLRGVKRSSPRIMGLNEEDALQTLNQTLRDFLTVIVTSPGFL